MTILAQDWDVGPFVGDEIRKPLRPVNKMRL
jgi:hypothetical protein